MRAAYKAIDRERHATPTLHELTTKSDTPFQPTPLVVTDSKGPMVTAQRGQQRVSRNSSFLKKSPRHPTEVKTRRGLLADEDKPVLPHSNTPHAYTTLVTVPRRSGRAIQIPEKFDDFVMI